MKEAKETCAALTDRFHSTLFDIKCLDLFLPKLAHHKHRRRSVNLFGDVLLTQLSSRILRPVV